MRFERVAIVGLGLIGGSLAMALRRRHLGGELVGADRLEVIEQALERGLVDRAETDPATVIAPADLVILAGPVSAIVEQLTTLAPLFRPGTLVTDVGSTKRRVLNAALALPPNVAFVGGHPMAGKAASGLAAAEADLFDGVPWAIVPREGTPGEVVDRLGELVRSLRARPVLIDPDAHDRAAAVVSHLPQLLSLLLCQQASGVPRALDLPGPAFRNLARLAGSSFPVWKDVIDSNQDFLRQAMEELARRLREAASDLTPEAMSLRFAAAREALARPDLTS